MLVNLRAMKKYLLILSIFILPFIAESKNLWAFLSYSTFNSPEGPYIETYMTVAGNSVKYIKLENGKFQATVNVLMTFKQNDVIKAFKKYELKSPEIDDTVSNNYEFIDQQRFQLPNGSYDFELQLSDKNKMVDPRPFTQPVAIDFPADSASFSSIEMVQSYKKSESANILTKSGYDLVPYIYNFYPQKETKMIFYSELYNMDKMVGADQKFVINYYLESFENNLPLNDFAKSKKETARTVNLLLTEMAVDNLATGNYNLVIEARNQKNEVIALKKIFFQRSNPNAKLSYENLLTTSSANTFADKIIKIDSLKEFISSTYPISTGIEQAYIREVKKSNDLKSMQQYFYGFWLRRDSKNPEKAWLAYKGEVNKVQYNFGSRTKRGYQTDRGRVYLQYGAPNARVTQYNEPASYPYEIWQYYVLNNSQRNKKFVFYSQDMVTSDFTLLHSDAIGEVNNLAWQKELRTRIIPTRDLQDTQVIKAWGEFSDDYWNLPN